MNQDQKARYFQSLHQEEEAFVMPNPYDRGTTRLLEGLGFKALATTSAGYALTRGVLDHQISREEMLAHCAEIVLATSLPVNADLGNGFGDEPGVVAETIGLAIEVGLAGASIEDMKPDRTLYPIDAAVRRIEAAAEAAHGKGCSFVLTARAENYLVGDRNLGHVITRLQAYQEAGADVLYAPGLGDPVEIAELVRSVDRPVNFLGGIPGHGLSVPALGKLGVKRISVGSGLAVAAFGAFLKAAREMRDEGTFVYANDVSAYGDLKEFLSS